MTRRVRRLERLLRLRHVDRITELVAVRSNLHDLYAAQAVIVERLGSYLDAGRLESGIDTSLNAVDVDADRTLDANDRAVFEQVARDAPVDVRLSWVDPASLRFEPL